MTDQQHPITPPPELVEQWMAEPEYATAGRVTLHTMSESRLTQMLSRSAQWGADQELEACLRLVEIDAGEDAYDFARYIRAARRPKPPTLNSIALQMLGTIERDAHYLPEITDTIRRALEALPND